MQSCILNSSSTVKRVAQTENCSVLYTNAMWITMFHVWTDTLHEPLNSNIPSVNTNIDWTSAWTLNSYTSSKAVKWKQQQYRQARIQRIQLGIYANDQKHHKKYCSSLLKNNRRAPQKFTNHPRDVTETTKQSIKSSQKTVHKRCVLPHTQNKSTPHPTETMMTETLP